MYRDDYNCYLQRLNAMPTRVVDGLALTNFRLDCYRQPILTEDIFLSKRENEPRLWTSPQFEDIFSLSGKMSRDDSWTLEDKVRNTAAYDKKCMMGQLQNSDTNIPMDDILDATAAKCKVFDLTTTQINEPPDNWEKVLPSRDLETFVNTDRSDEKKNLIDLIDLLDWRYYVLFVVVIFGIIYIGS